MTTRVAVVAAVVVVVLWSAPATAAHAAPTVAADDPTEVGVVIGPADPGAATENGARPVFQLPFRWDQTWQAGAPHVVLGGVSISSCSMKPLPSWSGLAGGCASGVPHATVVPVSRYARQGRSGRLMGPMIEVALHEFAGLSTNPLLNGSSLRTIAWTGVPQPSQ